MNDKAFETSLTVLTALVLLWIILGIVFGMAWGWVVLIGLAVEIVAGGYLLRRWGKAYMEKE
ncbi:MAG: hypothetical protein KKF26_06385 [Chloroflexi bacterium]|nr:hypothetical protein [Chloroflexota bacterium]